MEGALRSYDAEPDSSISASITQPSDAHGGHSRWLSWTQRRRRTWHEIDLAWLATFGRSCSHVEIHGDELCATSLITPCVQSADLRGTNSWDRRGGCAINEKFPFRIGADGVRQ